MENGKTEIDEDLVQWKEDGTSRKSVQIFLN